MKNYVNLLFKKVILASFVCAQTKEAKITFLNKRFT